ncbi:MAG: 16S rRNA (guanine(966)-N(2))-methyltransferase RsmD, partial [Clostridia bacterium]|nr:16S rRNA (guanine(966)-N(2))-methyltransferase RsmD [Clostridia bacterium]
MRVITGTAKGMRLASLEGDEVRPTYDRVKEAIFSIIQFDLEGRRVLDLFAGSGQLGIEALSRGAQNATFVDSNRSAIAVIKENLEKTRLSKSAVVLQTDAVGFIKNYRGVEFDVVLLDPPYHEELLG